jgi:hypothetical protein
MTDDVEHCCIFLLASYMFSFMKCLFEFSAYVLNLVVSFYYYYY